MHTLWLFSLKLPWTSSFWLARLDKWKTTTPLKIRNTTKSSYPFTSCKFRIILAYHLKGFGDDQFPYLNTNLICTDTEGKRWMLTIFVSKMVNVNKGWCEKKMHPNTYKTKCIFQDFTSWKPRGGLFGRKKMWEWTLCEARPRIARPKTDLQTISWLFH